MRVHRLEMGAFGPFADTEVIDFGPLNDSGIFLLTGPTGAGKTTILDAICFGLFGAVPGARNGAKDLKSHHADDAAAPFVVLEATLRGRTFRFRRSPAWSRPSRRAQSGHVDEPAKATAEELIAGSWIALSTRVDEVGLLVTRVLGMNKDQFCQVVMLPQGLFQTFLRAGAKERHDVLESLFETRRFGRVEAWLSEHRRSCERALESQRVRIRQLLARAHEVAGDVDEVVESEQPEAFHTARAALAESVAATTSAAFLAGEDATVASVHLKQHQHALDCGRDLEESQQRYREGVERLRDLDAIAAVVQERAERIRRAEDARSFAPTLAMLAECDRALARAEDRVSAAVARCSASLQRELVGQDADTVDAAVASGQETLARLEVLLEVEDAVRQLTGLVARHDEELLSLETRRGTRLAAAASVPDLLAQARLQLRREAQVAAAEPAAGARASGAERAASAARDAARLAAELVDLAGSITEARERQLLAHSAWLDLRERRLQGMAAELATQLSDGVACLVCGSRRHPAPATLSPSQVTAAAEADALEEFDSSHRHWQSLLEIEASTRSELVRCSTLAGGLDVAEATARLAEAARELEEAKQAGLNAQTLEGQIEDLDRRRKKIDHELSELDVACELVRQRRLDHESALESKRAELRRGIGPSANVEEALRVVRVDLASTASLADAMHDRTRRSEAAADAHTRLSGALAPSGFTDVAELRAAMMNDVDLAVAEALNRTYHDDVRDARRLADDPALVAAAHQPEPDLDGLASAVQAAEQQRVEAWARAEAIAGRRDRLEKLLAELDAALLVWQPLRAGRDRAATVAAMCSGTSADNLTKTRLSHYVLAARLEQVVAAANVRLSAICGGRYQLEHSMERGVGDTRGGLGLLVLDTHTGHRRDPATLSGGETFYVSLALALGLADLVRDEAGGAELSTLFVDEGFGTLDSDTLDEVMNEIDSLRSGGRCVGLVSHLSDLRMRIPVQVQVVANQRGSTLTC
jgi:DNA repair protein SbcC/Rad50